MHLKDFSLWHKLKTWLNNDRIRVNFHEKEIWFCYLGQNIGYEQDGKNEKFLRPVLVLKKFNSQIFWGIPLTKTFKEGKYYHTLEYTKGIKSIAILSQLKLFDAKRLHYHSGTIKGRDFKLIKEKLKQLLV